MVVARLVVALHALARDLLEHVQGDRAARRRQHRRCALEQVKRHAGIAARDLRHRQQHLVRHLDVLAAEAALLIPERPAQDIDELRVRQLVEPHDAHAREQGMVDLEEGILRRRADEDEPAILDVGQQHILLALVEAVDLVDEYDCAALVVAARLIRLLDDAPQVADARRDRIELLERAVRHRGNHLRERRLARARRSVEDDGRDLVHLDHAAQEVAAPDRLLLADELVKIARAHAARERLKRPHGSAACSASHLITAALAARVRGRLSKEVQAIVIVVHARHRPVEPKPPRRTSPSPATSPSAVRYFMKMPCAMRSPPSISTGSLPRFQSAMKMWPSFASLL